MFTGWGSFSADGTGVQADLGKDTYGVYAVGGTYTGIYASGSAFAGYFAGDVYVTKKISAAGDIYVETDTSWVGGRGTTNGWKLGRINAGDANNRWVYLSRRDVASTYADLAIGGLWAGGALRYDLAEMTPVREEDKLELGDVVSVDEKNDETLKKSREAYDPMLAGVVSSEETAALTIGGDYNPGDANFKAQPIALVGRILTKVSNKNGSIKRGDLVTSSDIPGYGMKATESGMVVGQALQDFDDEGATVCSQNPQYKCGKIKVFLHLFWYGGNE